MQLPSFLIFSITSTKCELPDIKEQGTCKVLVACNLMPHLTH